MDAVDLLAFALPLIKNPDVFFRTWSDFKMIFCLGGECSGPLNLMAASGVALVVKGRRVFAQFGGEMNANGTIPEIKVDVVG